MSRPGCARRSKHLADALQITHAFSAQAPSTQEILATRLRPPPRLLGGHPASEMNPAAEKSTTTSARKMCVVELTASGEVATTCREGAHGSCPRQPRGPTRVALREAPLAGGFLMGLRLAVNSAGAPPRSVRRVAPLDRAKIATRQVCAQPAGAARFRVKRLRFESQECGPSESSPRKALCRVVAPQSRIAARRGRGGLRALLPGDRAGGLAAPHAARESWTCRVPSATNPTSPRRR